MKIEAKPFKKIPDLNEFRHLGSLLTRSFVHAKFGRVNSQPFMKKFGFQLMSEYGHITPPLDFSPSEVLGSFFPNVQDWSNVVDIEYNPEFDHLDEDGNLVKGIPKD